ncbi:hypothetical protein GCM10028802_03710 [Terrabacter terrigena]
MPWWTDSTKPARTTWATTGAAASAALTGVDAVAQCSDTPRSMPERAGRALRQGSYALPPGRDEAATRIG